MFGRYIVVLTQTTGLLKHLNPLVMLCYVMLCYLSDLWDINMAINSIADDTFNKISPQATISIEVIRVYGL